MNQVQIAERYIRDAIMTLKQAKRALLTARNEQHVRLSVQVAELEEIHGIINDPECTPEIGEVST